MYDVAALRPPAQYWQYRLAELHGSVRALQPCGVVVVNDAAIAIMSYPSDEAAKLCDTQYMTAYPAHLAVAALASQAAAVAARLFARLAARSPGVLGLLPLPSGRPCVHGIVATPSMGGVLDTSIISARTLTVLSLCKAQQRGCTVTACLSPVAAAAAATRRQLAQAHGGATALHNLEKPTQL